MSSSSTVSWRGTSSAGQKPPRPGRLERRLFLCGLAVFLFLGGGHIASSDGNTMFALSESLLAGRLDIPAGNGKLAGILIEARWRSDRIDWVAIGIGVNVREPANVDAHGKHISTSHCVDRILVRVTNLESFERVTDFRALEIG